MVHICVVEGWYSWRFGPRFPQLKMNAADYWHRQVYATFQDDVPGVRCRDLIGVDKMMWGSDYPHTDGVWPESSKYIEEQFAGLPADTIHKITCENAGKFYGLIN